MTVTNPATGVARTATSNEQRHLRRSAIGSRYLRHLSGEAGIRYQKRASVQLEVNQSVTLDFKLGVASAAQTVEVTGCRSQPEYHVLHVDGCDWTRTKR